jgi:hypothetical protein
MMARAKEFLDQRQAAFWKTPFGCLSRLFVARMFHGGDTGAQDIDLGIGVILAVLAMPGLLVSLLMFEKYGSLIHFLRGERHFDPYAATTPDEYFFIVLSMVVTGAAALWRWDAIFPDCRDYANLVPLPISLRTIFFANFCAILCLAILLTIVVNAASLLLFPIAVLGSQNSFAALFRFAVGHTIAVFLASAFSFFAVFALIGLLMAIFPAAAFRTVSVAARFLIAVSFLALLASSLTVPYLLPGLSVANAHRVALLPPVSFLGLARTLWGKSDPFVFLMAKAAVAAVGIAIVVSCIAYALSFRRSFLRIPEVTDVSPLPRLPLSMAPLHKLILRRPSHRACYLFVARTLLRNDAHLQLVLGFLALGLVVSAETLASTRDIHSLLLGLSPPVETLAVPFILAYCIIAGIRFAFEIPADLRANWVLRYSLDQCHTTTRDIVPQGNELDLARPVARRVLLMFSIGWLAPATLWSTLPWWGWTRALLHTAVVIACCSVLVEILLIRFRKVPFACTPPPFQSHSGLILLAYLFGFLIFTDYIPQLEQWALYDPVQVIWFAPLLGIIMIGLYFYRKQMLDMDKQLIFEEPPTSIF